MVWAGPSRAVRHAGGHAKSNSYTASFGLPSVDRRAPQSQCRQLDWAALNTKHREPQVGPAQVSAAQAGRIELQALAKTLPTRKDRLWIDLYFGNRGEAGLRLPCSA